MRERVIEEYLRKQTEKLGGVAYKFVSPGRRGVPDRICCYPSGILVFVECKSPTGRLSMLQDVELRTLRNLGHKAVVIDSRPRVDALMEWVRNVTKAKEIMKGLL
jgi:hypothetical protein